MNNRMMLPIELTKILYSNWQGQISISSHDSQIYGKCLNGPAAVTFKNGNRYEGEFYNGLLHGKGKFTWSNGIVYKGDFTDNRITGEGTYEWPDGSIFEGQVKDGLRHGFGKYTIDEATYEGEWKEGKKHGHGKIIFKSGSIFEGDFEDDLKCGSGKMYYFPSGNFFEGEWRNDVKEGKGTMNWTDIREKYVGEWHNNLQEGQGMHIWLESKGENKFLRNRYEGEWKAGTRNGFGIFYYANGSRYEGYWKDNMKEGYAYYTNENGKTELLLFSKDRIVRDTQKDDIKQNEKKVASKKEVEPNFYAQCLKIHEFYRPYHPSLESLYNFLLRNNTQLKSWYKNISTYYEQQSELSFCLNFEGAWKMIRSLKILGDFSLATFNRGIKEFEMKIETLLRITSFDQTVVDYSETYYQRQAKNVVQGEKLADIEPANNIEVESPFMQNLIHDRQRNILFREFVHLLVWMGHHLDPQTAKPQKSIEKLITKITPFFQTVSKAAKLGQLNEQMSDNKSSLSRAQKSISPHFKAVNMGLLNKLKEADSHNILSKIDLTITIRELIGYGIRAQLFGEAEYLLLEKIFERYVDNQVLNRQKNQNHNNSVIPTKVLNLLNYELIEYDFIEIMYILFIKKLPSHKENEQNKAKYQQFVQKMQEAKQAQLKKEEELQEYKNEARYLKSKKSVQKQKLQEKRKYMEEEKSKRQAKLKERQREDYERRLMEREDTDAKNDDFGEEESQFQI